MSRIGKLPIQIPSGVKVAVADNTVTVEGPKGKLSQTVSPLITVEVKDNEVVLKRQNDERESRAFHGLYRSLVKNMVEGVSKGYKKTLVITGVGYKAEVQGKILLLSLGYSTQIMYQIADDLKIS